MFVGKDVARALGYSNTPKAVQKYVDKEDKSTLPIREAAYETRAIIINESGLYALVLSSKLPQAKVFFTTTASEEDLIYLDQAIFDPSPSGEGMGEGLEGENVSSFHLPPTSYLLPLSPKGEGFFAPLLPYRFTIALMTSQRCSMIVVGQP